MRHNHAEPIDEVVGGIPREFAQCCGGVAAHADVECKAAGEERHNICIDYTCARVWVCVCLWVGVWVLKMTGKHCWRCLMSFPESVAKYSENALTTSQALMSRMGCVLPSSGEDG